LRDQAKDSLRNRAFEAEAVNVSLQRDLTQRDSMSLPIESNEFRYGGAGSQLLNQVRPLISRNGFATEQVGKQSLIGEPGSEDRGEDEVDLVIFQRLQLLMEEGTYRVVVYFVRPTDIVQDARRQLTRTLQFRSERLDPFNSHLLMCGEALFALSLLSFSFGSLFQAIVDVRNNQPESASADRDN
jgi:hypothetical protein